jgi:glycosyltransferase involved in cell wall biosynthesis
MKKFLLSVVIPSYNEMANLQKGTLERVKSYLERQSYEYEVLVVDDGSTDGSREFVEKFTKNNKTFKLIKNSHTGKAGAVTTGVLSAKGDKVLFTDMDQATPIEEIEKLLPDSEKGFDVVIGSRSTIRKGAPAIRLFISRSSIILRKIIIGLPDISDTQCGFKLFNKAAAKEIFSTYKKIKKTKEIKGSAVTYGFDIELLLISRNRGYKVKEVPVNWLHVETRRVNPVNDSVQGVVDLLRIKNNMAKGIYK